ncbi:MAG: hypothetical protein KDA66_14430 [Planctomycetaceae bacterium]|nr:hypothetical protein [Planctomycetaceae bacterium]
MPLPPITKSGFSWTGGGGDAARDGLVAGTVGCGFAVEAETDGVFIGAGGSAGLADADDAAVES